MAFLSLSNRFLSSQLFTSKVGRLEIAKNGSEVWIGATGKLAFEAVMLFVDVSAASLCTAIIVPTVLFPFKLTSEYAQVAKMFTGLYCGGVVWFTGIVLIGPVVCFRTGYSIQKGTIHFLNMKK